MPPSARRWDGIPALLPLSWVYRGGVSLARALRTAPRPELAVPRIVAVGNLEVGGSGKTPLCLHLLERAIQAGKRTAYVSRGFDSEAERGPLITVVPGEEAAPASFAGLRVVARDARGLATAIGDEGAMAARRAPAVPLLFARDKRRAVAAAAQLGAEVVVVDDALQSFALARHVDVLLLDAARPLANGRLLPAGRLREAPSAIARAHVIVFNGASDAAAVERARERVARYLRADARVYGLGRRVTLQAGNARGATLPADAVVVSGIARPDRFRESVEAASVRVADALAYPDHHRYTVSDVRAIQSRARGRAVVTTEKDWVKLEAFDWGDAAVWVARLEVAWVGDANIDAWLLGG
jgi:tetraacyldisaccharide 4'-kinase